MNPELIQNLTNCAKEIDWVLKRYGFILNSDIIPRGSGEFDFIFFVTPENKNVFKFYLHTDN